MSKAEEKAFEYQMATCPNVIGGVGLLSEDEFKKLNTNPHFKAGYEQAEKDLALTWWDIRYIFGLIEALMCEQGKPASPEDKEFCEEVLRRFNGQKK